jgi:hypothetical protein
MKPVFKYDVYREAFLRSLIHVNKRYNWICHAYCLSTLLIGASRPGIGPFALGRLGLDIITISVILY